MIPTHLDIVTGCGSSCTALSPIILVLLRRVICRYNLF
jgi:hypothetical protein